MGALGEMEQALRKEAQEEEFEARLPKKTKSIADKTVILSLSFSTPGTLRSVKEDVIDPNMKVDREAVHVSKDILKSRELLAVWNHQTRISDYIKTRCFLAGLKHGLYILSVDLVMEVDTRLNVFLIERDRLRDVFLEAYPELMRDAKETLKDWFDPGDYPAQDMLKKAFRMNWQYLNMSTPGRLKDINAALFRQEAAKAEKYWADAGQEIQDTMRVAMSGLVDHMVERLIGSADGKKKTFHKSTIARLEDFFNTFKARNLTEDGELEKLVEKAKAAMKGIDVNIIRDDENARAQVTRAFETIKSEMDTMLVDRPKRKISFEEE